MAEGRTNFAVADDDWYVEPVSATSFLLARESFDGPIWDPACGQGNILKGFQNASRMASGSDAVIRDLICAPESFLGVADFLEWPTHLAAAPNIVCNPPYGKAKVAEAFIRHALKMQGGRKVAMFVNSKFMFSVGRANGLFADHPPSRIYPVLPRPSCPPGQFLLDGGKAQGGVENFVWMVWDQAGRSGETRLKWGAPQ